MTIHAPFTDDQIAALNRWQGYGYVHEFTCPNEHPGSRVLIAERNGWHCPCCDYRQTWAFEGMLDEIPPPFPHLSADAPHKFICALCGKSFRSSEGLADHQRMKHRG